MGEDRTLWKVIIPTAQCDSSGEKVLGAVLVPTLCIRRPLTFYELMKKDNCGSGGTHSHGGYFFKGLGGVLSKKLPPLLWVLCISLTVCRLVLLIFSDKDLFNMSSNENINSELRR